VEAQVALFPQDMDNLAWLARVLTWSGDLSGAEKVYLTIVNKLPNDPDNWMGWGNFYLRQGRIDEALRAMDRAVDLDPKRADLSKAHARALRAAGELRRARFEFQRALVALGRTRAPEGFPALADGLRDRDVETRLAALGAIKRSNGTSSKQSCSMLSKQPGQ